MKILDKLLRPSSKREMRSFGLIMSVFIMLVFGMFLPWLIAWNTGIYPWLLSFTFAAIGLVWPILLTPVFNVWMAIGAVLAKINTLLILIIIYVVLFIPIGLILRLLRYDPLKRNKPTGLNSYRVLRSTPLDKSSLENPF